MDKDNTIYLKLILDSIKKIRAYTKDFDFKKFQKDSKTQSAVLMQFQIIGELSKKINIQTKEKIDLPWKQIAGFRDIISHDYFSLDISFAWETIQTDLKEMNTKIKNNLK